MNKTENYHKNHRKRMRDKFQISGFESMSEHEILEFLLYYTIPVKDTNPIAHRLIKEFKTLEAVFKADIEELTKVEEVGEKTAIHLKAIGDLISVIKKKSLRKKQVMSTVSLAADYLTDFFINERTEKFYIFFLDKGNRITNYKMLSEGTIDSITIDTNMIVREAVLAKCCKVILAHNHPGGHTKASDADISATSTIIRALALVNIEVKDHIIISDGHYFSMAESGLLY